MRETISDILNQPWPWYISGPLLGLIVPILLIIGNKQLGVSSALRHGCAMINISKSEHFNYDWRAEKWSLLFVVGLLLAGAVVALFLPFQLGELSSSAIAYFEEKQIPVKGYFPVETFHWSASLIKLALILLGGFLVGFGARYANGCTSGHAIMGLSKLNLGSLIAVIGFFIGGVIGTWLIIDNIL